MRRLWCWLYDNSLSIAFFGLFAGTIGGAVISGRASYNSDLVAHQKASASLLSYLGTGHYLDALFVNWQAAILQLLCLITFGGILHQKGASHSRKPEEDAAKTSITAGDRASWVYGHSLSIAFGVLFLATFVGHIFFGAEAYNERGALMGDPPISIAQYFASSTCWFKLTQAWQAEFLAIGLFVVMSIYLRERWSAESKPVESADDDTGDANE